MCLATLIIPKSFNRAQTVFYKNILALQEHLLWNIQYREVFQALIKSNFIIIKMPYPQHLK